jgi:hypothetical protein
VSWVPPKTVEAELNVQIMNGITWMPRFTRGELVAALYVLGCVNGLSAKMILSVHQHGWVDAAANTFDISVIVIFACVAGISLVRADRSEVTRVDVVVALVLSLMMALPIGAFSWVAVTIHSLYLLARVQTAESPRVRRGAVILLAVTVPMLWSRLVFDLFANFILGVDAALVSRLLGTYRDGNMVQFADHSGTLVIFSSCSSLANVSLALLCWVTISEFVGHQRRIEDWFWCLLTCLSVIVFNVLRVSAMGLSLANYQLLHSPPMEAVLNVTLLILIVSICVAGTRREVFARA